MQSIIIRLGDGYLCCGSLLKGMIEHGLCRPKSKTELVGVGGVSMHIWPTNGYKSNISIFVNLGLFWHLETVTNIRTWIKSHIYWRML